MAKERDLQELTLAAPGCGLISLVSPSGFRHWTGTSFATPLVSGRAALILEEHAGHIPAQQVDYDPKQRAVASPDPTLPNGIARL